MLKFRTHSTFQDSKDQEECTATAQEALRSAPPSTSSVLQPPLPRSRSSVPGSPRRSQPGSPSPRPPHSFIPDHFTLPSLSPLHLLPTGPQSHCHLPHCPPQLQSAQQRLFTHQVSPHPKIHFCSQSSRLRRSAVPSIRGRTSCPASAIPSPTENDRHKESKGRSG